MPPRAHIFISIYYGILISINSYISYLCDFICVIFTLKNTIVYRFILYVHKKFKLLIVI